MQNTVNCQFFMICIAFLQNGVNFVGSWVWDLVGRSLGPNGVGGGSREGRWRVEGGSRAGFSGSEGSPMFF